ncbi:MAG TPA: sugar phosphate isomerase/epimerase family protein [Nitrososphaerales archaeon]|nr:sugar phosphate isomerase/epimerase family protein [Nitrososphaerales archaeon]
MKLGLSTWSLLGMDVYAAVGTMVDARIDYVELWGELPHAYPGWADERRLRDALSTSGLTVTTHAPFTDLNPAAPDSQVREAIQKALERFVEFSARLGASMVTVHPGAVHNELLVADSMAASVSTIRRMVKAAGGRLSINVENQARSASPYNHPLASSAESLMDLLSEVEDARCTLDTGHAFASGQDPRRSAGKLEGKVSEIHLSDNSGKSDEHLIPGEGKAPLRELVEKFSHTDALVCLEINPHVYGKEAVLTGFERAKRMFSPGNI